MPQQWTIDMNRRVSSGGNHWDDGSPPPPGISVKHEYRVFMSFNIATNLFGPDSDDTIDNTDTKFKEFYYEAPIRIVLEKFARRFRMTIPIETGPKVDLDEKEKLLKSTVEAGANIFDLAVAASSGLGDLPMKALYIKDDFLKARTSLLPVLTRLDDFRAVVRWICIPFLEYSRDVNDKPSYPRPDADAYKAHVDGDDDPVLPNGQHIGGPVLGVGGYSFGDFTYLSSGGDPVLRFKMDRARQFAAEWGFFDPLSVIERRSVINGAEEKMVIQMLRSESSFGILSSGNSRKCQQTNGTWGCVTANSSSFCVDTSCP